MMEAHLGAAVICTKGLVGSVDSSACWIFCLGGISAAGKERFQALFCGESLSCICWCSGLCMDLMCSKWRPKVARP